MSVRLKTFILLTIAVIVSIITYVSWYSHAEKSRMEKELQDLAENYRYAVHAEFKSLRERMLQLALFTANDDHVKKLMAAAASAVEEEGGGAGGVRAAEIRRQLYRHLHSGIKELALNFDIVTLHFHLTPGALSFLRFHAPKEMGDRLDDVRPMIVAAGREQQSFSGFEIGRYFAGVRAAVPIFAPADEQGAEECIGVVEFGTPIDSLLKGLQANRPWLNAAAFMNDAALQHDLVPEIYAAATRARSISTSEGRTLQLSATTSDQIEGFLELPDFRDRLSGPQNFCFTRADATYNAVALPLDNFQAQRNQKNSDVGRVVVWQDVSARITQYKDTVTSLIWYGVFLFLALEGCIYVALYLVSSRLKEELEHQRQLERVSGRAFAAVGSIGQVEQQPQLQLHHILQEQLRDALEQLGAEMGLFVSARQADGEFRILALSDMVWTTAKDVGRYERARTQLMQQGYIPMKMEDNILVRAMDAGTVRVLGLSECSTEITPFLPAGHPPIKNAVLVPIRVADATLGLLVVANSRRGFGSKEQITAKAYAGAAALLMHSDLREVERLSAIETARVKEELFRNLNHELRTPLNIINGMGRKLAETQLDSMQKHKLSQINQATERLHNLIEEVLLLASLDTEEKTQIQIAIFRPSALLAGIVTDFEAKARERGIELRCSWDEHLPVRFIGDSEKIAVILRQLVGNAIKFSRDAEVLLSLKNVSAPPGSEAYNTDLYTLRFAVTDHGIGIAPEQYARIFEPFYQCDTSRAREYEGTGLGLSAAHKLAVILGSEIKLESGVGTGSTFYFDLNLAPSIVEQKKELHAATVQPAADGEHPEPQPEGGDEAQLLELLRDLEEPLIHSRPHPCNAVATKLKAKTWPLPFASGVDKIIQFMDKYRYPEALAVVHRLQLQLEKKTPDI